MSLVAPGSRVQGEGGKVKLQKIGGAGGGGLRAERAVTRFMYVEAISS